MMPWLNLPARDHTFDTHLNLSICCQVSIFGNCMMQVDVRVLKETLRDGLQALQSPDAAATDSASSEVIFPMSFSCCSYCNSHDFTSARLPGLSERLVYNILSSPATLWRKRFETFEKSLIHMYSMTLANHRTDRMQVRWCCPAFCRRTHARQPWALPLFGQLHGRSHYLMACQSLHDMTFSSLNQTVCPAPCNCLGIGHSGLMTTAVLEDVLQCHDASGRGHSFCHDDSESNAAGI